jgi:hypothetical protein
MSSVIISISPGIEINALDTVLACYKVFTLASIVFFPIVNKDRNISLGQSFHDRFSQEFQPVARKSGKKSVEYIDVLSINGMKSVNNTISRFFYFSVTPAFHGLANKNVFYPDHLITPKSVF